MIEPTLLNKLIAAGAAVRNDAVEHFGDVSQELRASKESAVCAVSCVERLRVTGVDRAKFLHNFCTNNINNLSPNHACEAFFVDVKARVLAHGYVCAGDTAHDIWLIGADPTVLHNHLTKYIITEDVHVSIADSQTVIALTGETALDELRCTTDETPSVAFAWNGTALQLISLSNSDVANQWEQLSQGRLPIGEIAFHHHRVRDGFPIVGVDIGDKNLAPESGRNAKTISYTKGCYLGQEPIARIDAMGHVNKQLTVCSVVDEPVSESEPEIQVTSLSTIGEERLALSILPTKLLAVGDSFSARTITGDFVQLRQQT